MLSAHTVSMRVIVCPWKVVVTVSMRPQIAALHRERTLSTGSPTLAMGMVLMNCPGAGRYSYTRVSQGWLANKVDAAKIAKITTSMLLVFIT
jgi:hypothetical protein